MGSQLSSQSGHVAVQRPPIALVPQNRGGQVLSSDRSSSSFDQMEEEHALGSGERYGALTTSDGAPLGVDFELSPAPRFRMAVAHPLLDARHQLCHEEGFWNVVVGTPGEAFEPRIQVRPSRHHDRAAAMVAKTANELKPISIWEPQIEDHAMRLETLESISRLGDSAYQFDFEAGGSKPADGVARDARVVFDQQHPCRSGHEPHPAKSCRVWQNESSHRQKAARFGRYPHAMTPVRVQLLLACFAFGAASGCTADSGPAGDGAEGADSGSSDLPVDATDGGRPTPDLGGPEDGGANDAGRADTGTTEPEPPFEVAFFDADEVDPERQREVGARIFYPLEISGSHHVVAVSHGGLGADNAEVLFDHLGSGLASQGFVVLLVGHRRSDNRDQHRRDRPRDVIFLLDRLEADAIAFPGDFGGTLQLERVGMTGHSAGAFTTQALAGAAYPYPTATDPRIGAIAPISVQGVGDFFEAFDRGPNDSTWQSVTVPVFVLLGSEELSTNGFGRFIEADWRLQAFSRYPDSVDRIQVIIEGQDHLQMGAMGSEDVETYIARNIAAFFDVYLRDGSTDPCDVGTLQPPEPGVAELRRKPAESSSRLTGCE